MNFGITMLAVVAAGAAVFTTLPASAQGGGAIPGGIYEAFSEDAVGCDEGDLQNSGGFRLVINAEGTRVVELLSLQTTFMGTSLGDIAIAADVLILPDGTYSGPIFVLDVVIRGEGRFDGETVTGSFRVELDGALECEGTFVGHYIGQNLGPSSPEGAIVRSLPPSGTGPDEGVSYLTLWMSSLATFGAMLLGLGTFGCRAVSR